MTNSQNGPHIIATARSNDPLSYKQNQLHRNEYMDEVQIFGKTPSNTSPSEEKLNTTENQVLKTEPDK